MEVFGIGESIFEFFLKRKIVLAPMEVFGIGESIFESTHPFHK